MKLIIWHCDSYFIGNPIKSQKAQNNVETVKNIDVKNSLSIWITIESLEDKNYFSDLLRDIDPLSKRFNIKLIVLTPFVHLTNKPLNLKQSHIIIKELGSYLHKKGFDIKRAQFGSAKDLKMVSLADQYQCVYRSYPKPEFI